MNEVQIVSPAPRTRWRGLHAADPLALPEQSPDWVDALVAGGKYLDASRQYSFPDGRQFVMPLVKRRGLLGLGGRLQSFPPGWGMGGILGEQELDAAAAREILDDLRGIKAQQIAIRPNPLSWNAWAKALETRRTHRGTIFIPRHAHVADIGCGMDELWGKFSKSARRAVRTAQRAQIQIKTGFGGQLLDEYYELFLLSVERWAAQQNEPLALARSRAKNRDPIEKLQAMGAHLGDDFVVSLATIDGRAVAGSILLLGASTAHETRSAMDREAVGNTGAGELLQFHTLRLACQHGCQSFHMGESGQSNRLALFKEKFAAKGHHYAEIRLDRLPWTRTDTMLRTAVKKVLRFNDV
ncbi:GNAT family N-acetyltransferase [Glutamicibacter sp.]|uniref:GNAT family N-acetyltransferase n=1 Tax=Glutamicibacter sp. TaxID=1931995 RepID=UPI0028BD49E5|nr:GNAT family N-acetyltransferase [Glutamicibacter sp.]